MYFIKFLFILSRSFSISLTLSLSIFLSFIHIQIHLYIIFHNLFLFSHFLSLSYSIVFFFFFKIASFSFLIQQLSSSLSSSLPHHFFFGLAGELKLPLAGLEISLLLYCASVVRHDNILLSLFMSLSLSFLSLCRFALASSGTAKNRNPNFCDLFLFSLYLSITIIISYFLFPANVYSSFSFLF